MLTAADVGFSSRGDVHLGVDGGVYVRDAGQLRLRLSSRLVADVSASDAAAMAPVYRSALRDAAHDVVRGGTGRLFTGRNTSADGLAPSGVRRRCSFTIEAHATTVSLSQDWRGVPSVHIDGSLVSNDCGINVKLHLLQMQTEAMLEKAQTVGMLEGMIALAMISLTARQLEASASPAALQRISFGCICHQGMLDSCTCVLHLMAGIVADELFATFSFVSLGYFTLFTFLQMRLITGIWRSRLPNGGTLAELRDSMRSLHGRFYGSMMLCAFAVIGLRKHLTLLLVGVHSFWMWQIVHTALHDTARPLSMRYVCGMSACRLVMPCYFLGCPRNWARVPTHPHTVAVLFAWMVAQVSMVYAQHVWGARWFLPPSLRPPRYSYDRPATDEERAAAGWDSDAESRGSEATEGLECVICQTVLAREQRGERPTGRMVTPCGHFFHVDCLQSWMAIKLECPTCRGALPLP